MWKRADALGVIADRIPAQQGVAAPGMEHGKTAPYDGEVSSLTTVARMWAG